ncbi:MAG: MFS transporter, partial [Burkholderiales bacterium]
MKVSFWTERRTIVALAVSILTLAEIVDLTIVGVALPDIMGALGANLNEISLTMTSYIVASAIFIPLTGIISRKYGSKRLILASAFVFGVASVLCGLATNLPEMVVFRTIQGIGGAFLPAVSQAYIV